jgi:hypothetical protein
LTQEHTALAIRLAHDRETNKVYNEDAASMVGVWKVPEIEGMSRTFNENARFYALPFQK